MQQNKTKKIIIIMIIQICDHGKEHIFWKKKKDFTDVNAKKIK